MRKALARRRGERQRFVGIFERRGRLDKRRPGGRATVLLSQVADEYGNVLCDHLWLQTWPAFEALELHRGDRVSLEAKIAPYRRGRFAVELEYGFDEPSDPRREEAY